MTAMPSQKLIDFTVECEVSSRAYYEKRLQKPEWPGGKSGVTWAIGYDGGYASHQKLKRDWFENVSLPTFNAMDRCVGVKGSAAHSLLPQVRDSILIPWDLAMKVFIEADVPEYVGELLRAIPGAEKLPPDCLGVLFSIGYNRGNGVWTLSGDRYLECRNIRKLVMSGEWDVVAPEIRRMTRHWPSTDPHDPDNGLRARRMKEADLWEKGLKSSGPPATKPVVKENPPQQMPSTPAGKAEGGSGAGTVIAGGEVARQAWNSGVSTLTMILIGVGVVVAVLVIMKLVNSYRTKQNPVLARSAREPDVDVATTGG